MILKTIKKYWLAYKKGWLATLLMSSLVLSYCLHKCYFFIGSMPFSCGMIFFACYYLGLYYVARTNVHYARQLSIVSISVGILLILIVKGIMKIPMAASSLASQLLWEYPMSNWLLFYQVLLWLHTLSLSSTQRVKLWKQKTIDRIFPIRLQKKLNKVHWRWSRLFHSLLFLFFLLINWITIGELFWMVGSFLSFEITSLIGRIMINAQDQKRSPLLLTSEAYVDQVSYYFFLFLFVGVCLITNLLVVRHIDVGVFTCTAGVLTYPITFLLIDIITELYGASKAKEAIWAGFFSNLVLLIGVGLTAMLSVTVSQKLFWDTFGFVSASLVASMIAYMMSQLMSIYLFCQLKRATQGAYLWLRNNVTTIISQGADTAIFALVAWSIWYWLPSGGNPNFSFYQWLLIARNEYIVKIILALLDTPILYLVLTILKSIGVKEVKGK